MSAMINQTGACGLEPNGIWGDKTTRADLSSAAGKPYVQMPLGVDIETLKNNSVIDGPYDTAEVQVGIKSENDYVFNSMYAGYNDDFAWMWGFSSTEKVVVAVVADTAVAPAVGDVFTNGSGDTLTYVRKETFKDQLFNNVVYFIYGAEDDETVTATTGETLTANSGSDIVTISTSNQMFEHLFELAKDRRVRSFNTAEINFLGAEWAPTNPSSKPTTRCLMQTFAKNYDTYDLVSNNVTCESFSYKWSPASFLEVSCGTVGFRPFELEGGARNIDYDMSCDFKKSDLIAIHAQTKIEIGTVASGKYGFGGDEIEEDVTEANIDISVPMQRLQTTGTSYYVAEPWLEGKYELSSGITIGRHSATKFMNRRDLQTYMYARIANNYGFYSQEMLIKEFKLRSAGANDSAVAEEPLDLNISTPCKAEGNAFDGWVPNELYGGPVLFRTRDYSPYNALTKISKFTA